MIGSAAGSLTTSSVRLAGRTLGHGRCFVIAEAGVNHNGDLALARDLVRAAAAAGADAVKFQTFQADALASPVAPKAAYQKSAAGGAETQRDMLRRLQLTHDEFRILRDDCAAAGIAFMSSAFDKDSATFLAALGVEAIKIGSGELTDLHLLEHIGALGRPVILSTGMATLDEVERGVAAVRSKGPVPLAVLHCVSNYPSRPEQSNLRAMQAMSSVLGVPVGFSDHTIGTAVPLAAAALGAAILEKHLTLDRALPGPDHAFAAEPDDFRDLIRSIRSIEAALGDGIKRPSPEEAQIAAVARKSLAAARDLPAGTVLTDESIAALRPGTGLPPSERPLLVGRTLKVGLAAGELLTLDHLEIDR